MGALGNGRRGGRSPPLMIGALIACILVLGFNYWVSSSRSIELQSKMYELESQVRRGVAERSAVEGKKKEFQEELHRQKEQITRIENLYKRQLEGTQNTCVQERGTLQHNISINSRTIQDLKAQLNQLNDDLEKAQRDHRACQGDVNSLNKKLTYETTQCNTQILAQIEHCDEKVAAAKLEVQKKTEKRKPASSQVKATPTPKGGPPEKVGVADQEEEGPGKAGLDDTKTPVVLKPEPSEPKTGAVEREAAELLSNEIAAHKVPEAPVKRVKPSRPTSRVKPSAGAKPARQDQAKPDQATPNQAKLDQAKLDQAKLDQATPNQAKPDQAKLDQATPNQAKLDQAKLDQAKLDQAKLDQAKLDQAKLDQATPNQAKPDQAKLDQAKLDQAKPDQAKLDQAKQDQAKLDQATPNQAKPDQAKPDQAKPDQAKPDQARLDQDRQDQATPNQAKPDQARTDQARPDQVTQDQALQEDGAGAQQTAQGGAAPPPDRKEQEEDNDVEVMDTHGEESQLLEEDAGAEDVLLSQQKGEDAGQKLDEPEDYDADEQIVGGADLEKQNRLAEKIDAVREFEEELADYNGDDDNEGEFEADKQAQLQL